MKKTKKGFTLIELLVVIGIIGLLASLAIVSLNSARAKARDAVRIANMQRIVTSLEQFYDSKGKYPNYTVATSNGAGGAVDAAHGLGISANEAPDTFFIGLYTGGWKLNGSAAGKCYFDGVATNDCDLELTVPMPREPLMGSVNAGALCNAGASYTYTAGVPVFTAGATTTPCEYSYFAVNDSAGNRGFQDFNIYYALESSAPKQFGDGLLCTANKKGTKCSKTADGYTRL